MSPITPNLFAYVALLSWPLVSIILFRVLPAVEALLWTILGAQMFLPELTELKVEMLPQIDKNSIASICALVGCMATAHQSPVKTRVGLAGILLTMYFVGPLITSYLNGDVVVVGARVLPGVGVYDGISASISQLFMVIPFFLGRRYLNLPAGTESVLRVLAIAGLIYSLPVLFEVRMSSQLHRWIYGFFPSDFVTEGRAGGFRPVVFMGRGLIVAFFTLTSAVAAAALWRAGRSIGRIGGGLATTYLGGVLLVCKSWGALTYGIVLVPLVRFARPRVQVLFAAIIVSIALTYPVIRYLNLFPEQELLQLASDISPDRAASLQTRFVNEDQLLARASERFLFGWGRYGRNRVYDEESGRDVSLTDGRWIITLGTWGIFGFIAEFGLLALVVFRAVSALRFAKAREQSLLASLAVICAITLFEQLPNASIRPWTWLIAGALLGRSEALQKRVGSAGKPVHGAVRSKLSAAS